MVKKILVPGSVLLDIYEQSGEKRLGGASFNFAYHIWRLTGDVTFLSRVGDDLVGRALVTKLDEMHFPTKYIQYDNVYPTKTVHITMSDDNVPCFNVTKDVASERLDECDGLDYENFELVYFGTTIQYASKSRQTVQNIIARFNGLKFCDINLRNDRYSSETIEYCLLNCNILKLSHEELDTISDIYGIRGAQEQKVEELSSRFDISIIAITQAEKGSFLYIGNKFYYKKLEPVPIVDPVGAGDAYSAVLVIGCLNSWKAERILDVATGFALDVCNNKGAISEDGAFYYKWQKIIS